MIASTVFMSLALAGFGSYAYYMSQTQSLGYPDATVVGHHDWIPLLCVLVFTTALALGISPISWLLIGELFPLEYRGLGSSISTSFSYFCAFVGIKLFMDFQQVRRFNRHEIGTRECLIVRMDLYIQLSYCLFITKHSYSKYSKSPSYSAVSYNLPNAQASRI